MLARPVFMWISAAGLTLGSVLTAFGQDYPNHPIRMLTSAAGGGNDFMARLVAQWLSEPLGQQVIVDNRTSLQAAEAVTRATPDGYTLLFAGSSFVRLPLLRKNIYDPVHGFTPVGMVDSSPVIFVVHPSLPIKSIKELIALAKSRPGQLNYASGSIGGAQHLSMELFKAMSAVNIVKVSYKGGGPGMAELVAGQTQVTSTTIPTALPYVKSGKLRPLAVSSSKRSALAPDIPTVAASGVPGYEFLTVDSILGPPGMPAAIVNRLNEEIVRVLNMQAVKDRMLSVGSEAAPGSPADLAAFIKSDSAKLGKLIAAEGVR